MKNSFSSLLPLLGTVTFCTQYCVKLSCSMCMFLPLNGEYSHRGWRSGTPWCIRRRGQPVIGVGTGLEANSLLPQHSNWLQNLSKYIRNVVMIGSNDVYRYDCEPSVSTSLEHYLNQPLSQNHALRLRCHANVKFLRNLFSHIKRNMKFVLIVLFKECLFSLSLTFRCHIRTAERKLIQLQFL
jgi:hypothetical protein